MIVIGIDPGATIGWAILELRMGAAPRRLHHGDSRAPDGVPWRDHGVELMAVELPEGFYPSAARLGEKASVLASMAAELLATTRIGARLLGRAEEAGLQVIDVAPAEWRSATGIRVGGRGATMSPDQQTAARWPTLISGWPARSNTHQRDSAGAAIAGFGKWMARR